MNTDTLRGLSRAYAAGNIDRESYRRTRRDMLRRVVAGEQPLVSFHTPDPEMPTVFPYDENDGDKTQEIVPGAVLGTIKSEPGKKRLPLLGVLLGAAVLAGAGIAAFEYFADNGDADSATPTAPPSAALETGPAPVNPLDVFLEARIWTPDSMSALVSSWNALPETSRLALARSESANRLVAAVLQQIGAAEALRELGETDDALETESQLLDFVDHLGIDNARIATARAKWNEARAVQAAVPVAAAALPAAGDPGVAAAAESTAAPSTADMTQATPADNSPATNETAPLAEPAATIAPTSTPQAEVAASVSAPPAALPATKPTAAKKATVAAAGLVAGATAAKAAGDGSKPSAARSNCKAALTKTRRPYCLDVAADGTKGPPLVVLPGGRFEMGGREKNEQPRHEVTLSRAIAVGIFEVSAAEFALFCKATGASCPAQPWSNPAYPVVNVSWAQAVAYAQWLSRLLGATYRLPTEAEWEYAARGGSTTEYPFGDELLPTHARYSFKTTLREPLPARDRSLNRNRFRVYHIIGNVREWVADTWAATYADAAADGRARESGGAAHVVRGGSYGDAADALRSAARIAVDAQSGDALTGFRLVRLVD